MTDAKMLEFTIDDSGSPLTILSVKPDKIKISCSGEAERVESRSIDPLYISMGYKGPYVTMTGNIHVLDLAWFALTTDEIFTVSQSVYIEMPVDSTWVIKSKKLMNQAETVNRYLGEIEFTRVS